MRIDLGVLSLMTAKPHGGFDLDTVNTAGRCQNEC